MKLEVENPISRQQLQIDFSQSKVTMFDLNTIALKMKYDHVTLMDR